jgi:hypothetical protein
MLLINIHLLVTALVRPPAPQEEKTEEETGKF